MKKLLLFISIITNLFCEDVMVERMQSIVDEVTQLRGAYERSEKKVQACEEKLSAQEGVVQKLSRSEGMDYKDFENSRKKLRKLQIENKSLKNHKKEIETLEKENQRLTSSARILVDKNQELLKQVNKYKKSKSGELKALEIELKTTLELLAVKKAQLIKLQEELKVCASIKTKTIVKQKPCKKCPEVKPCAKAIKCKKVKASTVIKVIKSCEDDNPFPVLMQKETKAVSSYTLKVDKPVKIDKLSRGSKKVLPVKDIESKRVVSKKASSYRMKNETAVYDKINGNVVAIWEEKTSFTSNIKQGDWVKITGYFVHKKWQRAKKELWVQSKDTIKR